MYIFQNINASSFQAFQFQTPNQLLQREIKYVIEIESKNEGPFRWISIVKCFP